ncbi:hypothetical protein V6N13_077437 [Hibiscus sabdariffa]|uniref:Uncharacterized protein n=2 Tax=Hibiscus sabdariffa TaxID=183260 RepID=A0ABR2CNV7_9ROSI
MLNAQRPSVLVLEHSDNNGLPAFNPPLVCNFHQAFHVAAAGVGGAVISLWLNPIRRTMPPARVTVRAVDIVLLKPKQSKLTCTAAPRFQRHSVSRHLLDMHHISSLHRTKHNTSCSLYEHRLY